MFGSKNIRIKEIEKVEKIRDFAKKPLQLKQIHQKPINKP